MKYPISFCEVPLKWYWYCESGGKGHATTQKRWNALIDEILLKWKSSVFDKADVVKAIEYGDYLFVALQNSKIVAFAICQDHPSADYCLWKPNYAQKHGMFEISLICSAKRGTGTALITHIETFAMTVLLRSHLFLAAINDKLVAHYTTLGFQHHGEKTLDYIPMIKPVGSV